ncbi:MAG: hypothetical protein ABEJ98_04190 [Candidatus Nanohaloarchaea archaeon]
MTEGAKSGPGSPGPKDGLGNYGFISNESDTLHLTSVRFQKSTLNEIEDLEKSLGESKASIIRRLVNQGLKTRPGINLRAAEKTTLQLLQRIKHQTEKKETLKAAETIEKEIKEGVER